MMNSKKKERFPFHPPYELTQEARKTVDACTHVGGEEGRGGGEGHTGIVEGIRTEESSQKNSNSWAKTERMRQP